MTTFKQIIRILRHDDPLDQMDPKLGGHLDYSENIKELGSQDFSLVDRELSPYLPPPSKSERYDLCLNCSWILS